MSVAERQQSVRVSPLGRCASSTSDPRKTRARTMADDLADDRADRAAVEQLVEAVRTAWNTHDFKAYAVCFHDDADFTNVFGLIRKGRAEIETSHLTATFLNMFKDSR